MNTKAGYITFGSKDKQNIFADYSMATPEGRASAVSVDSNINIRNPFNKYDYDLYRPNEKLPSDFKSIIRACRNAYLKVGVVRNVIDMMTDFACEDFKIIHPDKKVEAFFKTWANKVKLYDSIDTFVRRLLVDCNVVVRRKNANLPDETKRKWKRGLAENLFTEAATNKIPIEYTFLNIAALDWIGGEFSSLDGSKKLAFRPSQSFVNTIKNTNDPLSQVYSDKLPKDLKTSVVQNGYVELDMSNIYIASSKKESWENWAPPFLYASLSDIQYKDKLRQAEIAALDGVINVIRIWKLGDHKEGILPNEAAVNRLISILDANTGGGTLDIVWDSMIEMNEYYPPIEKILGSEKYAQVNRDILIALGVPEVLLGGSGGNFSNSYIQLKTIIERLNSVRRIVTTWINNEVNLVCQSLGLKVNAKVKFNKMNLDDENVTKKLIVSLLDRGVISVEAVLDAYGEDILVEHQRIKNETQVGIVPKSPIANQEQTKENGRPTQSIDTVNRNRKFDIRRSSIEDYILANKLVDFLDEKLIKVFLSSNDLSNARQLTDLQRNQYSLLRQSVLSSINSIDEITDDFIYSSLSNLAINHNFLNSVKSNVDNFIKKNKSMPTYNELKTIEALTYADFKAKK